MKKILFVVTKSNFGGAQRYVFDLATNLPKNHFEVAVAFGPGAGGKAGRLAKMLFEKGIRTILIPELGRDISLHDDFKAYRALVRLFREEAPDVVHLNSSKAGGLGALAGRRARIKKIIFTLHGLAFDEKRGALQRIAIKFATWATILLTHHTIAITNDTYTRARQMLFLKRRVSLIHNGILTPLFLSKDDARREMRTLDPNIPEDSLWIGSIGELHSNKAYATAIDMVAFLESDAHLVIIGDGELRAQLEKHAAAQGVSERVHFLGFIPDAAQYLRAFNAFLLTSEKEGLPYVLLEAGYGYLPVVASDIPGVREVILHNFTGLIAKPDDAQAFSTEIEKVLNDATLARSLSDELLKRVQKTFSFDQMIEKTAALYTE